VDRAADASSPVFGRWVNALGTEVSGGLRSFPRPPGQVRAGLQIQLAALRSTACSEQLGNRDSEAGTGGAGGRDQRTAWLCAFAVNLGP